MVAITPFERKRNRSARLAYTTYGVAYPHKKRYDMAVIWGYSEFLPKLKMVEDAQPVRSLFADL